MSIYDFTAKDVYGKEQHLSDYKGKVLLVVNTATHCGFTPQYTALQHLYEQYQDQGLVILDFPCDQFGNQAPGTSQEVHQACVARFAITFPQFEKTDVNGDHAHPLFVYLKKALPGMMGEAIKWNFTKFLIDRQGNPVKRYAPQTTPESIEEDIEQLL